jgi:hypothetical protein
VTVKDVRALVKAKKGLSGPLRWVPHDDQLRLVSTLDIEGITQEGFWLRGQCVRAIPDRRVMFQLEAALLRGRSRVPLMRVDWRPEHDHTNKNIGPETYRLMTLEGSHYHPFDTNWTLGTKRMLSDNLPLAEPLERDPSDFGSLLSRVGQLFKIQGMKEIPAPEWEPELFGR